MNPLRVRRRERSDGSTVSVEWYVGLMALLAVALLAVVWTRYGVSAPGEHWPELAVLVAILCWTEAKPITIVRAGGVENVVASTTFAFAIFLTFGPVPAMVAQGAASALADVAGRKPLIKVIYNIAQYWVAWSVAAFVFVAIHADAPGTLDDVLTNRWYLALLGSGVAYFAVNNALVGIVVGLSSGDRVLRSVRSSITNEWSTDIVLLALTPIVVIVMLESAVALPLLLLPILAVYRSVTISAEKEHLARHDSLTGLSNRFNFTSVIDTHLEDLQPGTKAAVVLFDLDHFKDINDTLGHQAGDELLRMIGPRITGALPDGSTVGRIGGDEFAVLVPALSDSREAFTVAHRIAMEVEEPFRLEGFNIEVKGSIGIAIHPDDGLTSDELIKNADIAMYLAKTRGSMVERYDAELDHHSTRRLEMVGEMRTAIAQGGMTMYVQPKLVLATGRIGEVEALVRWVHPQHGLIAPSEFVPLSEHTGLIRPLTTYVLNQAVEQITRWSADGTDIVVAVNLSARSLHDGFVLDEVSEILATGALGPELLRFEITEGSIMADPARAMRVLERLADMGVRLSIDDFGTGYSSLAYLKDLPVDEIKIDRSFVTNLVQSEGDQVIVHSIIELAKNLGLTSVAEGVESSAALEWLTAAGCDQAQGYHVGRPMASVRFPRWLAGFDASTLTPERNETVPVRAGPPGAARC
jgi:diguanylate cyclase (GGDEF)-like protein